MALVLFIFFGNHHFRLTYYSTLVGAIVEWVRRILALTYLIIPNSPPPNSSCDAGAYK
jgi:hypothetical protein